MNLFWKNKFCFLLGLVTKTNPRLIEDKRALRLSRSSAWRKEIDTCLVKHYLFTHPFTNSWTPTHYYEIRESFSGDLDDDPSDIISLLGKLQNLYYILYGRIIYWFILLYIGLNIQILHIILHIIYVIVGRIGNIET